MIDWRLIDLSVNWLIGEFKEYVDLSDLLDETLNLWNCDQEIKIIIIIAVNLHSLEIRRELPSIQVYNQVKKTVRGALWIWELMSYLLPVR